MVSCFVKGLCVVKDGASQTGVFDLGLADKYYWPQVLNAFRINEGHEDVFQMYNTNAASFILFCDQICYLRYSVLLCLLAFLVRESFRQIYMKI